MTYFLTVKREAKQSPTSIRSSRVPKVLVDSCTVTVYGLLYPDGTWIFLDAETSCNVYDDGTSASADGSAPPATCSALEIATIDSNDHQSFVDWLLQMLAIGLGPDLEPRIQAFKQSVVENPAKVASPANAGAVINGRVYDHSLDIFGKPANQLSDLERQFYDDMKYAGPTLGNTTKAYVGTQINDTLELYAIKSDELIANAQFNGIATKLTPGNFVVTFYDRAKNMWVATYEIGKAELEQKAKSFLRSKGTSYEPIADQSLEDNPESYDWDGYNNAIDAADAAAAGC